MDNDDRPVGRVLSRREVVALMGMSGVALLAGCRPSREEGAQIASNGTVSAPSCVVLPEQTEGPYFTDVRLNRTDIRSDPTSGQVKAGVPLLLTFVVSRVNDAGCTPLEGAMVDVWHCDAEGIYSDVQDPSFNTRGQKFLRGHQLTDSSGTAKFSTIYPGWYRGRATHIHFKVRTNPSASSGHEFTSQLYFDEAVNDRVFQRAPYSQGGSRTRNEQDGIFRRNGKELILPVSQSGDGYAGTMAFGMRIA